MFELTHSEMCGIYRKQIKNNGHVQENKASKLFYLLYRKNIMLYIYHKTLHPSSPLLTTKTFILSNRLSQTHLE